MLMNAAGAGRPSKAASTKKSAPAVMAPVSSVTVPFKSFDCASVGWNEPASVSKVETTIADTPVFVKVTESIIRDPFGCDFGDRE